MRLVSICLAATLLATSAQAATIIHAGTLIVDPREAPLERQSVVIEDGRIARIESGFIGGSNEDRIVDLSGQVVLPGLIDSHVHLSGDPSGKYWEAVIREPAYAATVAVKNAHITLHAGFTTVRDVGSRGMTTMHAVRDSIRDGNVPGPRIQSAGSSMAIVGGHGDVSGFAKHVLESVFPPSKTGACTGAVECVKRVREASKYGADVIKITATGGVLSQQGRGLDQHFFDEEMEAIMKAAHALGLKVAAHAHGAEGIKGAVRAGVDSIEHGTYLDEEGARLMAQRGAWMVPTLMAFEGVREGLEKDRYTPVVADKVRQTLEVVGRGLRNATAAGVSIAFGTDAGVFEHGRNAGEFPLMMRHGGLSAEAALASATVGAAELLGMSDRIGSLEPGKYADLIAVNANPLEDVETLLDVPFVMKGGKVEKDAR